MKRLPKLLFAVICCLPMTLTTSCATTNLINWGLDKPSVFHEPDDEFSRGMLKPVVTFVGVPVAAAWDVVTFPFQIIFGTPPYSTRYMTPEKVSDI